MKHNKTVSSIFLAPTLKIPSSTLKDFGFVNAFIKDENLDVQYDNAVYLLFKPIVMKEFNVFLQNEYNRTDQIVEDYNLSNGGIVVVYLLDSYFIKDFTLIKKGKYSKTSAEFQKLFKENIEIINNERQIISEKSIQYKIFNKTLDLKNYWEDQLNITFLPEHELWDGFNFNTETLKYESN